MLGLTDHQLSLVIEGADRLPVDKRDVYLQRIGAQLTLRGAGVARVGPPSTGGVTNADPRSRSSVLAGLS